MISRWRQESLIESRIYLDDRKKNNKKTVGFRFQLPVRDQEVKKKQMRENKKNGKFDSCRLICIFNFHISCRTDSHHQFYVFKLQPFSSRL